MTSKGSKGTTDIIAAMREMANQAQKAKVNKDVCYLMCFTGPDGKQRANVSRIRPRKEFTHQTFLTDASGSADDKMMDFCKRNNIEFKWL